MIKDHVKVGQHFYDSVNDIWTVRLQDTKDGSDMYIDCKRQIDAEILSRIVCLEEAFKKLIREMKR